MDDSRRAAIVLAVVVAAVIAAARSPEGPLLASTVQSDSLSSERIVQDETGFPVDVSADGRAALFVRTNMRPAELIVRDLRTGRTTRLVPGSTDWERTRPAAIFSPDGTQVAFAWTESAPESPGGIRTNMRLIDATAGATARTIAGAGHVPHGWSPDGSGLLLLIHGAFRDPQTIAWLSLSSGSTRVLKVSQPWRGGANAARPRLSPDGRFIAYTAYATDEATTRSIYLMDANGENERALVTLNGNNVGPIWTPDGRALLFVNERPGQRTLYSVPTDGRAASPVKLRESFRGETLRVSTSGDLFYWETGDTDVQHIARAVRGGVRVEQTFVGRKTAWSKDRRVAFFRPGSESELVIRSLDGRSEVRHKNIANANAPPRWLADSSGLIVHVPPGRDAGRPGGSFYRVDARTGEYTRLFGKDTAEHSRSFIGVLSPDTRTMYLVSRVRATGSPWTRIVAVDLATFEERMIAQLTGEGLSTPPDIAVSPDGSTLAIRTDTGRLMTVGTNGSAYREIVANLPGFSNPFGNASEGSPGFLQWTSDGKSLLFPAGGGLDWKLMRVAARDGQREPAELEWGSNATSLRPGRLTSLEVSPDGTRIAFGVEADPVYDLWKVPRMLDLIKKLTSGL